MGRKNRRRNNMNKQKTSKVIRCTIHTKPVFEHDSCSSHASKQDSDNIKNCMNCKHSL